MIFKDPKSNLLNRRTLGLFAAVLLVGIVIVVWATHRASAAGGADAESAPQIVAGVAKVERQDLFKDVTYLAEFRPYQEVELHAKVTGYVGQMNVDFGDRVKAGQVLATLEVPELQAELDAAQAAALKAQVDFTNAHLIYMRLLSVNKEHPNLVAQQDLDTASANDQSSSAAIAAARAETEKYQTMAAYTNIVAPFDGIVSRRYVDPGALISAGTSADPQARALLRVSDNYRLRMDFPVTVDYVKDVEVGAPVEVTVDSLGGKSFTGRISRFTHDVNDETRKMTTEIEVTNQDLLLIPGMYATVTLKVEKHSGALAVPTEAVVAGKAPSVYIVNQNNEIEQRPITLGLETPDKYEVLSGLQEGELVVIGNHSAFRAGEKVQPKLLQLSMRSEN